MYIICKLFTVKGNIVHILWKLLSPLVVRAGVYSPCLCGRRRYLETSLTEDRKTGEIGVGLAHSAGKLSTLVSLVHLFDVATFGAKSDPGFFYLAGPLLQEPQAWHGLYPLAR